jgi:hypothetical protein
VEILRQHQAIYHAIRRGDAESAYRTMRNHINYVIRFFAVYLQHPICFAGSPTIAFAPKFMYKMGSGH